MNKKNIICKCKKFGGYTEGYICRICKLPMYAKGEEPSLAQEEERECKCIKCVGNCNHFGCKFHTRTSPQRKSVPVPEKLNDTIERWASGESYLLAKKINAILDYLESWRKG